MFLFHFSTTTNIFIFHVWVCVYVWVLYCVGVLVIRVLVFTVFCIVYTVFVLFCLCLFLFVLSVLVEGLLSPSDNSIAVNNNNNNNNNNNSGQRLMWGNITSKFFPCCKLIIHVTFTNHCLLREGINHDLPRYVTFAWLSIDFHTCRQYK